MGNKRMDDKPGPISEALTVISAIGLVLVVLFGIIVPYIRTVLWEMQENTMKKKKDCGCVTKKEVKKGIDGLCRNCLHRKLSKRVLGAVALVRRQAKQRERYRYNEK